MIQTLFPVPGRLKPFETGTPLAYASDIYDDLNNKTLTESVDYIKYTAIDSYGPYSTIAAAHEALSSKGLNKIGKTVGIVSGENAVMEYWYQGGTEQVNLVSKQTKFIWE